MSSIKVAPKVLTFEAGRALSAFVPCADVAKSALAEVAALPNPNAVLAAVSSAAVTTPIIGAVVDPVPP